MFRTLIVLALGVLLWHPAAAQTHVGTVSFNGRSVPLPPGEWRQVATTTTTRQLAGGGGVGGRNAQLALLRVASGRVTGLVTIETSVDVSDNMAGWTREPECQRNDIHAVVVESDVQRDQNCWTLNHLVMTRGPNASEFVNTYYAAAAAAGGMPPTMLRVTSRRSDNLHFVTVRYHFAPDHARFAPATEGWRENPWHRDRLDGSRSAYVAALRTWAPAAHAAVLRGFRGGSVTPLTEP